MNINLFKLAICLALSAPLSVRAADSGSTWEDEVSQGNWFNSDNWEGDPPLDIPFNRTGVGGEVTGYTAHINGGLFGTTTVSMDGAPTLDGVDLAASVKLKIPEQAALFIVHRKEAISSGTLTNNGTIEINGTPAQARLVFTSTEPGAMMTLTGTGKVVLIGNPALLSVIQGTRVTQTASHTIEGGGQVVLNNALINQGTIRANTFYPLIVAGGTTTGVVNTGLLEATDGGTLRLGTLVDNSGGVIRAAAASVVELTGRVNGGPLQTSGNGEIRAAGGSIQGVTNQGLLRVANGSFLQLIRNGSSPLDLPITNNGVIRLDAVAGGAGLQIASADMVLEGTGVVQMSNAAGNSIVTGNSAWTLEHGAGHTIEGSGTIRARLFNQGLIQATQSTPLILDLSGGVNGITNQGVLRANGGTLRLLTGTYLNDGGIIQHLNGSVVELRNATIIGGNLTGNGSGAIRIAPGFTSTLDSLEISTRFEIPETSTLLAHGGTITNNGTIAVLGGTNTSFMRLTLGDVTLAGGGTLDIGNSTNSFVLGNPGSGTQYRLTNSVGHTISGGGQLGENTMGLTNFGLIRADRSVALTINPNASGVTNNGTFTAASGSTLVVTDGLTNYNAATKTLTGGLYDAKGIIRLTDAQIATNAARIVLDGVSSQITRDAAGTSALAPFAINAAGASIALRNGRFLATADTLLNAGTVEVSSGSILALGGSNTLLQTASGVLKGNGTVVGNVIGGTITPGNSPGVLTIDGDWDPGVDGKVIIEVGGTATGEYDVLHITGTAKLGGILEIQLVDGFVPTSSTQLTFLQAAGISGVFSEILLPDLGPNGTISILQGANFLGADIQAVPEPSTYALMLLGLGALALAARRQRRFPASQCTSTRAASTPRGSNASAAATRRHHSNRPVIYRCHLP